ncbi:MAG: 2-oxo acid dehydrogenase subunit E2 [Gammaproteobacteria bacterium]|nr:2-oxo acid dehydrogenase subunit E2 [Gammaproteobacteria bacterium]
MSTDSIIRMPQLGLTMTEGLIVEWLANPGQQVTAGEVLFVVETDKIANEVVADRDGVFGQAIVPAGETVPVGTVIGEWAGAPAGTASAPVAAAPAPAVATLASTAPPAPRAAGDRLVATPHARKLARERGLDLADIAGSGPKGRIKAADVLNARAAAPAPQAAPRPTPPAGAVRRAMSPGQQVVATRMAQSKREVPHFYLEAEADVGALLELHRRLKAKPQFKALTLTHWIVLALGRALAAEPLFRTIHDDGQHLELPGSDVALAVAAERGLYVPVVRNVGALSLPEAAAECDRLTQAARAGRITQADSGGGATCISNLGATRVKKLFPIIMPGQSSILGLGRTNELFRPDAAGKPRLARELGLVFSFDHRVYNGIDGARLLGCVVEALEAPVDLLLPPV